MARNKIVFTLLIKKRVVKGRIAHRPTKVESRTSKKGYDRRRDKRAWLNTDNGEN